LSCLSCSTQGWTKRLWVSWWHSAKQALIQRHSLEAFSLLSPVKKLPPPPPPHPHHHHHHHHHLFILSDPNPKREENSEKSARNQREILECINVFPGKPGMGPPIVVGSFFFPFVPLSSCIRASMASAGSSPGTNHEAGGGARPSWLVPAAIATALGAAAATLVVYGLWQSSVAKSRKQNRSNRKRKNNPTPGVKACSSCGAVGSADLALVRCPPPSSARKIFRD